MTIYEKLSAIQVKLNAPKKQYNSYGKYNYRSCEDILEGLKPHLEETKTAVTVNDEISARFFKIYTYKKSSYAANKNFNRL